MFWVTFISEAEVFCRLTVCGAVSTHTSCVFLLWRCFFFCSNTDAVVVVFLTVSHDDIIASGDGALS